LKREEKRGYKYKPNRKQGLKNKFEGRRDIAEEKVTERTPPLTVLVRLEKEDVLNS
jgi:hypothetical protein